MTTPQDKANELYSTYMKGYLLITDVTTARINSKDCVHSVCDSMIDEILTFGKAINDNTLYTLDFWRNVKSEVDSIAI